MTKDPSGEFAAPESTALSGGAIGVAGGAQWFGHPRGLSTLFFTEMWERFSYYGMRAILFLFMVAEVERGGFGLTPEIAGAIYGLYTAGVYLFALPGGWLADKLIGQRRAIWYGGIIIATGHFSMAVPRVETFFLGLVLIVIGTGLLKPNISTIVGDLYPEGGARRDAGFSVFYMGINIGAFLAPLICGYLGENVNWHYGFAAAGFGMVVGLIQYKLTERHLGTLGTAPSPTHDDPSLQAAYHRKAMQWMWIAIGIISLVVAAALMGVFTINAIAVSSVAGGVIIGVAIAFFAYVLIAGGLDPAEKRRIGVIAILFVFSAMFWSGFEQAGSSLNLFAERYTDRVFFGWEMPASWLQSVNPLLIIALAPIFGMLWIRLAQKNLEPSSPLKFAFGLILLGLGFVVMIFAARIAVAGGFPSPMWLVLTYLLHTSGELALSPVGLSAVTKLAPRRFVGQMMGIWFISISLGNLIAGRIAGRFDPEQLEQMPDLFLTIVLSTIGAGVVLAIASRPMRKWIGERE
jgi:proton-dependent oligopeptide transporter, POT family